MEAVACFPGGSGPHEGTHPFLQLFCHHRGLFCCTNNLFTCCTDDSLLYLAIGLEAADSLQVVAYLMIWITC